jgi:hypothetical protein
MHFIGSIQWFLGGCNQSATSGCRFLRLLAVEIAQTVIDHTQASQGTEPATSS